MMSSAYGRRSEGEGCTESCRPRRPSLVSAAGARRHDVFGCCGLIAEQIAGLGLDPGNESFHFKNSSARMNRVRRRSVSLPSRGYAKHQLQAAQFSMENPSHVQMERNNHTGDRCKAVRHAPDKTKGPVQTTFRSPPTKQTFRQLSWTLRSRLLCRSMDVRTGAVPVSRMPAGRRKPFLNGRAPE